MSPPMVVRHCDIMGHKSTVLIVITPFIAHSDVIHITRWQKEMKQQWLAVSTACADQLYCGSCWQCWPRPSHYLPFIMSNSATVGYSVRSLFNLHFSTDRTRL